MNFVNFVMRGLYRTLGLDFVIMGPLLNKRGSSICFYYHICQFCIRNLHLLHVSITQDSFQAIESNLN